MGEEQAEVEGREGKKEGRKRRKEERKSDKDGREEKHYLMDGEEGGNVPYRGTEGLLPGWW